MLEAGTEVDRYIVEAELGEGGLAQVFRVRHRTLSTLHALKVLKVTGTVLRQRLVREGQLQASVRHPNIVAVTDVIEVDGAPGLIMEYVPGRSLDYWLLENRPDFRQAERILRGVIAGLAEAHGRGLIHRDLKPGNVLVEDRVDGPHPKIADFGLAKIVQDSNPGAGATRSGVAMGTPSFMSPEQIQDAKYVDQRTDIWALGCILYEMLVGQPPFVGSGILQIFTAASAGDFIPPEQIVTDLPRNLAAVVRGCLVVDRDARFPDCAAVLAALDGCEDPADVSGLRHAKTLAAGVRSPAGTTEPAPRPAMPHTSAGAAPDTRGPMAGAATPAASAPPRPAAGVVASARDSTAGLESGGSSGEDPGGRPAMARQWLALTGAVFAAGLVVFASVMGLIVWSANRGPVADAPPSSSGPAVLPTRAEPGAGAANGADPGGPPAVGVGPAPPAAGEAAGSRKSSPVQASGVAGASEAVPPDAGSAPSTPVAAEPPPAGGADVSAAPQPSTGGVRVSGDARRVVLVGADGREHAPGDALPVGNYDVRATFSSGATITRAGLVSVRAGETAVVTCSAAVESCR